MTEDCRHVWGHAYTEVEHQADDTGYVDLPDGRAFAVGLGHSLIVARPLPGVIACSRCGATRLRHPARRVIPATRESLSPLDTGL